MRDTRACRACLDTEGKLERIPDSWYRMFENLSGVQASKGDGYPNYFCTECKSHINKAIAFRKKSRRAFYVLKEIMLVRHEVNLSDIMTVNRANANLKSGLGLWTPESAGVFTVHAQNEDLESQEIKGIDIINSSVVIDIKGEIGEFPEEVPEEVTEPEVQKEEEDVIEQGDDFPGDDIQDLSQDLAPVEQIEPELDIDMDDIFKGLKEPESEKSDSEEEIFKKKATEETKGQPKTTEHKEFKPSQHSASNLKMKARALVLFDIQKLSVNEQEAAFQASRELPAFKAALYTCGICIKIFSKYDSLMRHYNIHLKKKDDPHICDICKDKFKSEMELNIHTHEIHLYKYSCLLCEHVAFSLRDMLVHKQEKHPNALRVKTTTEIEKLLDYDAQIADKFFLIPISDDDKVDTMKRLSNAGTYSCHKCGMTFARRPNFVTHFALHQRYQLKTKNAQQCPVCNIWLASSTKVEKHMEICHNYVYHCKECSYEAPNKYLAEYHFLQCNDVSIKCHCGAKVKTETGLTVHFKQFHWTRLYKHHCIVCGNGYRSDFSLYIHQMKYHGMLVVQDKVKQEGAEHVCKHCNLQFLSEKAYCNHVVKAGHEEASAVPYKCTPCKKCFESEEEMKAHYMKCSQTVTTIYPLPCEVCGEVVNNYREYYHHCLKVHPNYTSLISKKRKLCHACGKTYTGRCTCAIVKKKVQMKVKIEKYKCALCKIAFSEAKSVIFHVLAKHNTKPFSCNICNKKFKRRYDCRDHIMKIHAPVKPYLCPICDRDFAHLDFLKKHGESNHGIHVQLDVKTRKKKRFFLYPNMKVDLSLIDKRIIDDVKVEVADYTDQIFEQIHDYSDYIITNEDVKREIDKFNGCKSKLKIELKQEL